MLLGFTDRYSYSSFFIHGFVTYYRWIADKEVSYPENFEKKSFEGWITFYGFISKRKGDRPSKSHLTKIWKGLRTKFGEKEVILGCQVKYLRIEGKETIFLANITCDNRNYTQISPWLTRNVQINIPPSMRDYRKERISQTLWNSSSGKKSRKTTPFKTIDYGLL